MQRSLVCQSEALLTAVSFLAVAWWIASVRRGILYAQVKLTLVPTLSTRVVFAIPIAVFDLKVIPDNLMVWLDTWLLAAGAWLFGAWLHI